MVSPAGREMAGGDADGQRHHRGDGLRRRRAERIALNECTFWSGRPHDYNDPEAIKYFPQIRDLVFAGKFQEAEKMADEHFCGVPAAQQAYQPLGDLLLSFDGDRQSRRITAANWTWRPASPRSRYRARRCASSPARSSSPTRIA